MAVIGRIGIVELRRRKEKMAEILAQTGDKAGSNAEKALFQHHTRLRRKDVGQCIIITEDSRRIPRIAKFFDRARRIVHNRGYLTYTGTVDGIKVSAVSTEASCPCAAIGVEELANVGGDTFIRIGPGMAIQGNIKKGDLIIPVGAMRNEGTTNYYCPENFPAVPDIEVLNALVVAAERLKKKLKFNFHVGVIGTDDAFYRETPEFIEYCRKLGVLALDMESSAIFIASYRRGCRAGSCLGVEGTLSDPFLDTENTEKTEANCVQVAIEAFRLLEKENQRRVRMRSKDRVRP